MYTDMREEARDHARVRNAYFDQVSSLAKLCRENGWALCWEVFVLASIGNFSCCYSYLSFFISGLLLVGEFLPDEVCGGSVHPHSVFGLV
jgi:hypothetical protein